MRLGVGGGRRPDAGYTMVELAVAVAVSGVVVSGAVALGAAVLAEHGADNFGERLGFLVQTVDDLFSASGDYEQLNMRVAIDLGVFAYEQVDSVAGTARHRYGQPITLGALRGAGFGKRAWGLHYARLPAQSCVAVVKYALALGDAVALVSDPGTNATPSSFAQWGSAVAWGPGGVTGFPPPYRVLKNRLWDAVPVVTHDVAGNASGGVLGTCNAVTFHGQKTFGLAMLRSRY